MAVIFPLAKEGGGNTQSGLVPFDPTLTKGKAPQPLWREQGKLSGYVHFWENRLTKAYIAADNVRSTPGPW